MNITEFKSGRLTMTEIDKNKTYTTVCNYKVRIYATDGAGHYPVHGAILSLGNRWEATKWTDWGENIASPDTVDLNLIEAKPRIKGWVNIHNDGWVNIYNDGRRQGLRCGVVHASLEEAMEEEAVARIQIDIEEGEGL